MAQPHQQQQQHQQQQNLDEYNDQSGEQQFHDAEGGQGVAHNITETIKQKGEQAVTMAKDVGSKGLDFLKGAVGGAVDKAKGAVGSVTGHNAGGGGGGDATQ